MNDTYLIIMGVALVTLVCLVALGAALRKEDLRGGTEEYAVLPEDSMDIKLREAQDVTR